MRMSLAKLAAGAAFCGALCARAENAKFDEVFGLLKTNLTAVSETDFNRAALEGLLDKLRGRAELIEADANDTAKTVSKTNIFDNSFGYVRLERVRPGLGAELEKAIKSLKDSGAKGLVLDLRFAGGSDHKGAIEAASVFLSTPEEILRWGSETGRATGNGAAADLPLVALVNKETRGAAESLAAALRDRKVALIIGQPTAGQAHVFEDFPLTTGQKLRVARGPVELPGGKKLTAEGLTPDIAVQTNLEAERRWIDDPYLAVARGSTPASEAPFLTTLTNRTPRRVTGADVGRRHREELEGATPPTENGRPTPPVNVVQDPALARALDFLKGITLPRLREAAK